jgi:hypothetical protein
LSLPLLPPFPLPCRVGRTGRAGAKGTAITFIAPDEEQYAPDLVKALKESSAPIPQDLQVGGVVVAAGWAAGSLGACQVGWFEWFPERGVRCPPMPCLSSCPPAPLPATALPPPTGPNASLLSPPPLQAMADAFEQKRKEGRAQLHSSGFGGSGFKFDASEDNAVKAYKKVGGWDWCWCCLLPAAAFVTG